jgi:hypothetical protein
MQKSSIKYLQIESNCISKRSYTMTKLTSSQGCRDGSTYANHYMQHSILAVAKTKPHNHLNDAEKACNKIQHLFMIKALMKLGIQGMFHNIIKLHMTSL